MSNTEIGPSTDKTDLLSIVLKEARKHQCESAILFGSRVGDDVLVSSDFDVLLLMPTQKAKKNLVPTLKKTLTRHRLGELFDGKILTMNEFRKYWNGPHHFFLWECTNNGVVLLGDEIDGVGNLNPVHIRAIVLDILDNLDNLYSHLVKQVRYTACAVNLYTVSKTLFYLRKDILLDTTYSSVNEWFQNQFDTMHKSILTISQQIRDKNHLNFGLGLDIISIKRC
ncbi:MAG: hypothetical protein P1Q69_10360 [Candidatus Thorarchaeota archaeon]|nr:hypothetical protein [Candidatus Thorarchaeota archaeon]